MTDWKEAFAGNLQPGNSPALLMVDPVNAYIDAGSPLFLKSGLAAVEKMAVLVEKFRDRDLPVVWTGVRYQEGGADGGHFFQKVPALEVFVGENPLGAFPPALSPEEGEPVFIKQYPSAFFSTQLDRHLHERGIDTLFICGFSTSGCVRASTLDALQYGFIPFTVSDASADRQDDLHTQNLRDLGAKYAEIVDTNAALALIAQS